MTRPIELWYWPTPNGWKASIALEEMGLAYEMKPVNIGVGEQFQSGFQAISPNGRRRRASRPRSINGCSGRSAGWDRWRARRIISASMRRP